MRKSGIKRAATSVSIRFIEFSIHAPKRFLGKKRKARAHELDSPWDLNVVPGSRPMNDPEVPAPAIKKKKKRGSGFARGHVKSKRGDPLGPGPGRRPASLNLTTESVPKLVQGNVSSLYTLHDVWSSDWRPFMLVELEWYEKSGMLALAGALLNTAPASTYLLHSRGTDRAKLKRMHDDVMACMRWCAEAVHRRNKMVIPFTMLVRSMAHVGHKINGSWAEDGAVLAKKTAVDKVIETTKVRPPPSFEVNRRISVNCYDQVFRTDGMGAKKGRTTAHEHIDATDTAKYMSENTFVNIFATVPGPL